MGFWKKVAGAALGISAFTPLVPLTAAVVCAGAVTTIVIKESSNSTEKEREFADSILEVFEATDLVVGTGWEIKKSNSK